MRILVTGSNGFLGKNLIIHLNDINQFSVLTFSRANDINELEGLVEQSDAIIHLAGENRPKEITAFETVNVGLTEKLCDLIRLTGRKIPFIFASSTQVDIDNPYGKSKLAAEKLVQSFVHETGCPAYIFRLPGVFGKWCKPNYNSVVATFCHNIARDLPIQINDAETILQLVYVDDVIKGFLQVLEGAQSGLILKRIEPLYNINLGDLVKKITSFQDCRTNLISARVGNGLTRALYSTYISFLPPEKFAYDLKSYGDDRGNFVEMLKTPDCGQFSFFTVHPGIMRGSHYHHTKTEKFLVLSGVARMRFRHLITGEIYEVIVSGEKPQVVDTVPGWVHDITNVGESEVLVMLWANEIFDRQNPDCIPCKV